MDQPEKPHCDHCHDALWVCENHTDKPWSKKIDGGCQCGAGAPCPVCNDGLQRGDGFDYVLASVSGNPGAKGFVQ